MGIKTQATLYFVALVAFSLWIGRMVHSEQKETETKRKEFIEQIKEKAKQEFEYEAVSNGLAFYTHDSSGKPVLIWYKTNKTNEVNIIQIEKGE